MFHHFVLCDVANIELCIQKAAREQHRTKWNLWAEILLCALLLLPDYVYPDRTFYGYYQDFRHALACLCACGDIKSRAPAQQP